MMGAEPAFPNFNPLGIEEWLGELAAGFAMTVYLYFVALIGGFVLGLGLALARQYGGRVLSRVATAYIEVIRGTPLLAQLFLIYFVPYSLNAWFTPDGPPLLDVTWSVRIFGVTVLNHAIFSTLLSLGLNSAAYQAEYMRGAMASIGSGQMLAAQSLGFTKRETLRYIIIPQSFRRMIPSWSNEASYLPKYTVVATFVAVEDLFGMAKLIVSRTFLALQTYVFVGALYLALISVIAKALDVIYERTKIPGL